MHACTHLALLVTRPSSLPWRDTNAPPLAPLCTAAVLRSMVGRPSACTTCATATYQQFGEATPKPHKEGKNTALLRQ